MKTAENATHQVRIAMREMRNASRDELRQRLPHLTAEQVSNGVDNLASQKHVKAATKTRHKMTDGRTKMVWIYRYIGPEFDQPRKPPRHVKSPETLHRAQPMSAIAARTKKHVAQATSGYAAGHFTADMRANDWPPGFTSRIAPGPALPSTLQTIARRESDSASGKGWGDGTQVMMGTPNTARPKMMVRAA